MVDVMQQAGAIIKAEQGEPAIFLPWL